MEILEQDLEQADRALINKVYHMLFDIGSDFESVIRMLYSFRNGPKSGIKVANPEDNYEWTNKDGNEKYSTKNLPKAHFRWDWRRYTLSKESVDKITEFVDTILESSRNYERSNFKQHVRMSDILYIRQSFE